MLKMFSSLLVNDKIISIKRIKSTDFKRNSEYKYDTNSEYNSHKPIYLQRVIKEVISHTHIAVTVLLSILSAARIKINLASKYG